jgi:hypothetical protein
VPCPKDYSRHTASFLSAVLKLCGLRTYPSAFPAIAQVKCGAPQERQPTSSKTCRLQSGTHYGGNDSTDIASAQPAATTSTLQTPEQVLLRRVYFMNPKKNNYVSHEYYPARNYDPCVEFGGPERRPVFLTSFYPSILSQCLIRLCKSVCQRIVRVQIDVISTADRRWKKNNNACKLTYNKCCINFKLDELNYLLLNIAELEDQLSRYSIEQNDVLLYVAITLVADVYGQPRSLLLKYILYLYSQRHTNIHSGNYEVI